MYLLLCLSLLCYVTYVRCVTSGYPTVQQVTETLMLRYQFYEYNKRRIIERYAQIVFNFFKGKIYFIWYLSDFNLDLVYLKNKYIYSWFLNWQQN